jgi:hypothetical protein
MRLTHLILHEAAFQTGSLSLLTASETRQHIYQRYEGGAIRIARLWRSDAWVVGFHFDKRRHTDECFRLVQHAGVGVMGFVFFVLRAGRGA